MFMHVSLHPAAHSRTTGVAAYAALAITCRLFSTFQWLTYRRTRREIHKRTTQGLFHMFTREAVPRSDWYRERLSTKQKRAANSRASVRLRACKNWRGRSGPIRCTGRCNQQVNEVQLGDGRAREHERIKIGLAHAARQFVQHGREFDPSV